MTRIALGIFCLALADCADNRVVRAVALADRCDFQGALEFLDVLPPHPRAEPEVTFLRARVLMQLGRGAEALNELSGIEAVPSTIEPGELELISGLAYSLDGQQRAAEETLGRAEKAAADRDLVDGARAVVKIRSGKNEEAEKLLIKVLKRSPVLTGALFNLGCLRAAQGRTAEAAALVRQAWYAGLRNPRALRDEPMLRTVRANPDLLGDLLKSSEARCVTY